MKNIFTLNRDYTKHVFSIIKSATPENRSIFHKLKSVVFVNLEITLKLIRN